MARAKAPPVEDGQKWCLDCSTAKPLAEFYNSRKGGTQGKMTYCKPCCDHRTVVRSKNAAGREHERMRRLERRGNLTEDHADARLAHKRSCYHCGREMNPNTCVPVYGEFGDDYGVLLGRRCRRCPAR